MVSPWQISAGTDDCDVYGGAIHVAVVDQWFSHGAFIMETGSRFLNVDVPQGSTILTAKITIWLIATTGTATVTFKGEDVDDSTTFSTFADFNGRTRTAASVVDVNFGGNALAWNDSDDLSSIIQEIVNRVGWASGNSISILTSCPLGELQNQGRAWDNVPLLAAKLYITYNPPSGVSKKRMLMGVGLMAKTPKFTARKVVPWKCPLPLFK